jgi:hypothetical protein
MADNGLEIKSGRVSEFVILTPELMAEKNALLAEGFGDWTKVTFNNFLRACAKVGRNDLHRVAKEIAMPLDDVKRFAHTFWSRGAATFSASDWERFTKQIEKGEKKLEEISRLTDATEQLIRQFDDPWEELVFRHVGNHGRIFSPLEDRYLLCLTQLHGYGAWDRVRDSIRRCEKFRFDYFLQSCSTEALGKRCESLMRAAERELNEMEKKRGSGAGDADGSASGGSPVPSMGSSSAAIHEQNVKKVASLQKQVQEETRKLAAAKLELKTGKVPSSAAVTRHLKAFDKTSTGDGGMRKAGSGGGSTAQGGDSSSSLVDSAGLPLPKAPPRTKSKVQLGFPKDLHIALYKHVNTMPYQESIPKLVNSFVDEHPHCSKRSTEDAIKGCSEKKRAHEVGMTGNKQVWVLTEDAAAKLAAKAPKKRKAPSEGEGGGAVKKLKKTSGFAMFRREKDIKTAVDASTKDIVGDGEKRNAQKAKFTELWSALSGDDAAQYEEKARKYDEARAAKAATCGGGVSGGGDSAPHSSVPTPTAAASGTLDHAAPAPAPASVPAPASAPAPAPAPTVAAAMEMAE